MCSFHRYRTQQGIPFDAPVKSTNNWGHFLDLIGRNSDDCILWERSVTTDGYPQITRNGKRYTATRLSLIIFSGHEPADLQAAHSCNVRRCVNPRHLRWATRLENQVDRIAHGTTRRGEQMHSATITATQAAQIKRLLADGGMKQKDVAVLIGCTEHVVSAIARNVKWRWVDAA